MARGTNVWPLLPIRGIPDIRGHNFLPAPAKDCFWTRGLYHRPIEIQIREAQPSDGPVIADFNLKLAEETEALILDAACVHAGVAALLNDPVKGLYYLAEIGGVVAGQVMITYEWSDWRNGNIWWLQSVYVARPFRRQGVFRALFAYLQDLAQARNEVCALRLYMHADNAAARRSYEGLGMKHTKYEVFEMELPPRTVGLMSNPITP